jgi:hypothetical protein
MTDKWRWILMLWHDWRSAIWRAEMCLYPVEHSGNMVCVPNRHTRAETMCDYHYERARRYRNELFPPEPVDLAEFMRPWNK